MTRRAAALVVVACALQLARVEAAGAATLPPSPYRLLASRVAASPPLDGVVRCRPPGASPLLVRALAEAEQGELEAGLARIDSGEGLAERDRAHGRALVAARGARGPAAEREARGGLARLGADAAPGLRACAALELARFELRAGLLPEAAVSAARARRALDPPPSDSDPSGVLRLADFVSAEALRALEPERAAEQYARLAAGDDDVARAAALRVLERELQSDPRSAQRSALETQLEARAVPGADPNRFAASIAELAIAADDLEAARRWLARSDLRALDRRDAALVEIRHADVLVALGRGDDARSLLRAVAARHAGDAPAALANARLVAADLGPFSAEESERRLLRSAQRPEPALSLYARGLLARAQLRAGRFGAAIETLTRLLHAAPPAAVVPGLEADVGRALELAVAADRAGAEAPALGCARLWTRLGGRRSLFLRYAPEPAPFLALGDCALELGLAGPALDTFRAVTRRFGTAVAGALTERLARASLASGELAAARARGEALLRRAEREEDAPARARWQQLLAEVAFAAGDPETSAALLEPALASAALPPESIPAAALLYARALHRAGASAGQRQVLRRALAAQPSPPAAEDLTKLGEAALHAADLERAAGRHVAALPLAARAGRALEPGPLRARAAWWEGRLSGDLDAARDAWRRAGEAAEADPWARLAREEIGISRLREAVAAPAPAIGAGP